MDHFIQVYVTSCDACQKNKASHKAKIGVPQLSYPPERPWEALTCADSSQKPGNEATMLLGSSAISLENYPLL